MSAIIHCFFLQSLYGCLEWHFRVYIVSFMSCISDINEELLISDINEELLISDINEELLFPFLQENIKNVTLNTNLDSWYYQQKTAFYNELSITAYIHL